MELENESQNSVGRNFVFLCVSVCMLSHFSLFKFKIRLNFQENCQLMSSCSLWRKGTCYSNTIKLNSKTVKFLLMSLHQDFKILLVIFIIYYRPYNVVLEILSFIQSQLDLTSSHVVQNLSELEVRCFVFFFFFFCLFLNICFVFSLSAIKQCLLKEYIK